MKTIKVLFLAYGLLAGGVLFARAQGFVNLNFESAVVVPTAPIYGWLDWNLAVPGWSHSSGSDTSIVYWGSEHVGFGQYYLLADSTSPAFGPRLHLAGSYSLAFASGVANSVDINSPWVNAFISQTGTIPDGTHSLRLLATGPFVVLVGGVNIPMYSLGGNSYGGDISSFAGTVAELKIMNTAVTLHTPTVADNITFSPIAVPEPTSLAALFATSVALLCISRRKPASETTDKMIT